MFSKKNKFSEFFEAGGVTGTRETTEANSPQVKNNIKQVLSAPPGYNTAPSTTISDSTARGTVVNKIIQTKKKLINDLKNGLEVEYTFGTNALINNNSTYTSVNKLNTIQNREVTSNNIKLNKIQNDILTVRRLIEHNENNYQLKQDQLHILKNIFFCLVIVIILISLSNFIDGYAPPAMNNIGGMGITKVLALCVVGICTLKIAFYYYTHRLRNNVISRKYDWPDPSDLRESEKNIDISRYKIRALTCTKGSHPSTQNPTKCVQNKCRCDNGVAKKGIECEWDTQNNTKIYNQDCKKCNTGYTLVKRNCVLNNNKKCQTNQ